MSSLKKWGCITKRFKCSSSDFTIVKEDHSRIMHAEKSFSTLQQGGGYISKGNTPSMGKLPCSHVENVFGCKTYAICSYRRYAHGVQNDPDLSRDFLALLWNEDRKKLKPATNRKYRAGLPLVRLFSGASAVNERSDGNIKSPPKQPPTSQSVTGILEPISLEESKVAPLLARSNLLITRDIEWANLTLGIEQQNRYAVVDVCYPQSPVGFIREQSNWFMRQFLRLRRPFVASITDALGNEIFRVRRPFWWITSSIYAEINGKEIGVVHRRWHLWRRIYDLYLGNKQFAVVENPGFWFWTFTLKDIDGNVLAEVDRDWRGFGFELFTDAGQYVVRFGSSNPDIAPPIGVKELEVKRPLTLSERAVAVALAISLDNDYFSRHGGWGMPHLLDHD